MSERVIPVGNRVLIKENEPEEITAGGVVLVPFSDPLVFTGKVVAIGSKRDAKGNPTPMEVTVGDKVYYTRYARNNALEVEQDDEKFVLIDGFELLAKETV